MISIHTANVTTALAWGLDYMQQVEQNPRNIISPRGARTVESPEPVCTVYWKPCERVLRSPVRDANPFFHFFEGLWMLAGRNDVSFLAKLNKQISAYSDDGAVFWGAYGHRWRKFFGYDQLDVLARQLRLEPDTRRAVLTMWTPNGDTVRGIGDAVAKDVPCNTQIYFKVRQGKLNMMVNNRSNDMLWGAYGANAVHMSMLQEYMAGKIGVEVGVYRQVSDSFHVYLDAKGGELWTKLKEARRAGTVGLVDPYKAGSMAAFPMDAGQNGWDRDLEKFFALEDGQGGHADAYETPFFGSVVLPMWRAWVHRDAAELKLCEALDWRVACTEWLARRAVRS